MPLSSKITLPLGLTTLLIALHGTLQSADNKQSWGQWAREKKNLLVSAVSFAPTLHANDYFGQGPFTFHAMLEPYDPQKTDPYIMFEHDNKISTMYDGNKVPLFLSNIPRSPENFKAIRESVNLPENAQIGLHTLNKHFERAYVWLKPSIEKDGHVTQHKYSTIDYGPPTLIDLIRGAYNLSIRDLQGDDLTDVHCKAGKGRSACVIVAYLMVVFHNAKKMYADGIPYTKQLSPAQVVDLSISYAQKKRHLVNINANQKPALITFCTELQKSGDLKTLYQQNIQEIKAREAELYRNKRNYYASEASKSISTNHKLLPYSPEQTPAQTGEDSLQKMLADFEKIEIKEKSDNS